MAKKSNLEGQLKELEELHKKGVLSDDDLATRRATLLTAPAAAVVVTKKGGFPIFRVGCLGVIALVVVIIIVAVASSGGGSSSSDVAASGGGTPKAGTNKGDVHVILAPNASGDIAPEGNGDKKTRVTILQIVDGVKSTNSFETPGAGKKWIGFEVQLTNVGTAEVTGMEWKLHDSADFEHDSTFVDGAGDALDEFANLTPGAKTQGWIFFEVASDAATKWLRADPNPFLKNDLYFDAAQ